MITYSETIDIMKAQGQADALELQAKAPEMSGTEINADSGKLPLFSNAVKVKNMLDRPIGFVCVSDAGRAVKLLQPYDSNTFTQQPEDLSAQWGFYWSTDPKKARPFVAISTSPYNIDDCCTEGTGVYASTINGNVFAPSDYPAGWRYVGETGEV